MPSTLNYWRADNMWAAAGRPDGNLGEESVTVADGQKRVFITDWKYEKQRNDGTNYYGSHGRRLANKGTTPVYVRLTTFEGILPSVLSAIKAALVGGNWVKLDPGKTCDIKADIQEVSAEQKPSITKSG